MRVVSISFYYIDELYYGLFIFRFPLFKQNNYIMWEIFALFIYSIGTNVIQGLELNRRVVLTGLLFCY